MIIKSDRWTDEEKRKMLYENIFELLGERVKSKFLV